MLPRMPSSACVWKKAEGCQSKHHAPFISMTSFCILTPQTNTAAKSITNQSSLNQLLLLTASAHQEGGFLVGSIETNRKDSPSGTPGTTQKTFTAEEPAPPPQQQQQLEKKDQDTASKSPWINFQTTDMPCITSAHGDASKTVPWDISDPTCEFDTR